MSEKQKMTVYINGREVTLVHDEPEDYIQRVVLYLNNKIQAIAKGGVKMNEATELALTSINITDELFKAQKNYVAVKNEVKRLMDEYEELKRTNSVLNGQIEQLLAKVDSLEKDVLKKDVQISNLNKNRR